MSRLRPLTDPYDELTDRLAEMPDHDRPYRRQSEFPSARAFIDAMDAAHVADPLPAMSPAPAGRSRGGASRSLSCGTRATDTPVNVVVLSPVRESAH